MSNIAVFIDCLPPTTTAQQKGAFAMKGGGVRFFKKKKTKAAEAVLATALRPHAPAAPFAGPLSLCIDFVFPWRKTEKKSRIAGFLRYPIETRPDVDNIAKAAIDQMCALGFFRDDGQLAVIRMTKHYGDRSGIGIVLTTALATDKTGNVVSADQARAILHRAKEGRA